MAVSVSNISNSDRFHSYSSMFRTLFVIMSTFVFLSFSAVTHIDEALEVGDGETRKMILGKEAAASTTVEPRISNFLTHCQNADKGDGKRPRSEGEDPAGVSWRPQWGICKQDAIVGSTLLSRDWSAKSITPVDQATIVQGLNLDDIESAQGHERKDQSKVESEAKTWESRCLAVEKDVAAAKTEIEKPTRSRRDIIEEYMDPLRSS